MTGSILGPPPEPLQGGPPTTDVPATSPPTQVQPFASPTWVPHPSGEADLQARNTLHNSRSATVTSWDAISVAPASPPSPTYTEIHGPATLTSPMAQDDPESEEGWFSVAVSHPYELNGASAASGEEGMVPSRRSHFSYSHSSPGADKYMRHCGPPSGGESGPGFHPLETSPSVHMRDLTEVREFAPPTDDTSRAGVQGPFRDTSLVKIPGFGLQPAPEILLSHNGNHPQRGRSHLS
ncbi:hypothetical protein EV368DRAFT_90395 [Lentinula lateritia]|nr:hypothetical protein EV368DRAFT_90395 [Lentinula lateritia]